MKMLQDVLGKKFTRTVPFEYAGKDRGRNRLVKCLCDCGVVHITRVSALVNGGCESCGCLQKDRQRAWLKSPERRVQIITHGMSQTPTWVSWNSMMQRCFNPNRNSYKDYGGRGILPCPFIAASPANVVLMIGERPNKLLTIDRIENEHGGYTCGNCDKCKEFGWKLNIRWATRKTQNRNRRDNIHITINGITKTRPEWAEDLGKSYSWVRKNLCHNEIPKN